MKKNIKYIYILGYLLFFISCKNEVDSEQKKIEVNLDQKFIEDNFLKIVDTTAYSKGGFITSSRDTIAYSKLSVKFSPSIDSIKELDDFIKSYFEENQNLKKIFHDVLTNKAYSKFTLDSSFPKKIGKYYIFFNENEQDIYKKAHQERM